MMYLVVFFIGLFIGYKVSKMGYCPRCGEKLDYNYVGYEQKVGYCHNCRWSQ